MHTNKGKQEIKAAVIAHLQQIGEPIMINEPPSTLGLTVVPPAHLAVSPELSASSVPCTPIHDTTSSASSLSCPPVHDTAFSACLISTAIRTPMNDTAYSLPSNTIL
eukprot:8032999-Ditylum_brightwellii.AAC.1